MYSLEDVMKMVNKKTGLVPVRITKPFNPYKAGDVAGFPPNVATQHLNNEVAEPYKVTKADREALANSVAPFVPPAVPGMELQGTPTKYHNRPEVTPHAQVAPSTFAESQPSLPKAEIPEDWKNFGAADKRQLAASLSGRRYQELSVQESEAIIEAAIEGQRPPEPTGDVNELGDQTKPTNGITS